MRIYVPVYFWIYPSPIFSLYFVLNRECFPLYRESVSLCCINLKDLLVYFDVQHWLRPLLLLLFIYRTLLMSYCCESALLRRCFLEVFMRQAEGRLASQSISACCHLEKRTIDCLLLLIFLFALVFHCHYIAGKRRQNWVCDSSWLNLVCFGRCLFPFTSLKDWFCFLSSLQNLSLGPSHTLCFSLNSNHLMRMC